MTFSLDLSLHKSSIKVPFRGKSLHADTHTSKYKYMGNCILHKNQSYERPYQDFLRRIFRSIIYESGLSPIKAVITDKDSAHARKVDV